MVDVSDPATAEATRIQIDEGISAALGGTGQMVTRWVAMVEVIDTNGVRAMWSLCHADAQPWDTLGLLGYGMALEQAAINAENL